MSRNEVQQQINIMLGEDIRFTTFKDAGDLV
jgi:hypothetical protein